ncbi:hypothetical protein OTU49_016650 [Cherax quadricarinatus]|uniref:XLF-like N-terminal domain-containing protein n=1 Tax=Cherax quadricarinatus TaxID=27406 RepID=A0AAW0Y2Z8_CHEQU
MASLKIWRAIEESPWGALPSMGPQWMIKSCTNNQGYLAMVTDGCGLWGEKRNAKYILEQAEFNHHWVTPMLVQVQQLASRVNQLTTEVEHKRRQLDELLPDNKSPASKAPKPPRIKTT